MTRRGMTALACTALLALSGCQVIYASITSPSDWVSGTGKSISGSFEGLSRSSGSGGDSGSNQAYRRDLRAYSAEFAGAGGSSDEFLRGVGRVAESHGVTHWESNPATMLSIGAGLRDAGVSEADLGAVLAQAGDADPAVLALVREGFTTAR